MTGLEIIKENRNSNAKQIWEILADYIIVIMSLTAENISVLPEVQGGQRPCSDWDRVGEGITFCLACKHSSVASRGRGRAIPCLLPLPTRAGPQS